MQFFVFYGCYAVTLSAATSNVTVATPLLSTVTLPTVISVRSVTLNVTLFANSCVSALSVAITNVTVIVYFVGVFASSTVHTLGISP